jgi:hypothetical protein
VRVVKWDSRASTVGNVVQVAFGSEELQDTLEGKEQVNLLYAFLWVIPRRLNFICRRFGTLCMFHLHRQVGSSHLPAYEDGTECSETSAYKTQTSGNHPEESIQYSGQGEGFKSRKV